MSLTLRSPSQYPPDPHCIESYLDLLVQCSQTFSCFLAECPPSYLTVIRRNAISTSSSSPGGLPPAPAVTECPVILPKYFSSQGQVANLPLTDLSIRNIGSKNLLATSRTTFLSGARQRQRE
ncbi:hypothetical protein CY34DRAFT_417512 [Suillus luteus UH-Slu-Lm8-n1]|uniref:Uncharacterized protein n=1 Tax=Suillus luteus UH-Slu-Lm8-n1 TaxID=930992 RepID=A0A0D0A8I2_9AGAM|nr:hypothetical protein CY34DRAFT_417512 [Suillus luteus UH-Slu-Lm8-n1]